MREIVAKKITQTVRTLCIEANTNLSEDVLAALNKALAKEESSSGQEILKQIINNAKVAWREKMPLCQDTGLAIVFVEIGQDVHIIGGNLKAAINEGVSSAYDKGHLRKSVTKDPLKRENTGNNLPAIIHLDIVPGENIRIRLLAKGGGAENCSAIKMFNPSSTKEEINSFVLDLIEKNGPNPCPPMIIGIGVGGSFDYAPLLAKESLMRELGKPNSDQETAAWENELLEKINATGIGPMGLGGNTTALAVHIERYPCHISSLPVAVNIQCHSHRYKEATL
ncbi:fumarate hydratase [candidate division WOR-1 bacterium RIFOXYB2_FULL_42_35]|uniref:Fumarate hydratase n=1 Tax=candidate division WOR-1 bacterium RIFOXYC2_FULL_41_25 TaxID=1802586 RepID=A0A1F4TJ32_UNCSA|nr:MAG: fumarate hydratase [candidate division WOR-1 bacterium RIFOXYA2_FULL_41_14]OGC21796.1 MAG: fumarate hydratase [candidate division WOR-1 bacterium RIFOXYB2_FULL_42_35]OGC32694.1 MAG: fumarate hydratase [candidate division WOR-1 bacterium RIFOXYC2_FULL_41_25]OGC41545.1 MAG: fumarate hydratase [candidate division WOR-1 bacterium RIFOXYD2_FULL_41_8]